MHPRHGASGPKNRTDLTERSLFDRASKFCKVRVAQGARPPITDKDILLATVSLGGFRDGSFPR